MRAWRFCEMRVPGWSGWAFWLRMIVVQRGLNQLVGEPAVGKTTLALLASQQYQAPLILVSEPLGRLASLAPKHRVVQVQSIVVAFELIYQVQEGQAADMVVLDDLASLVPSHPKAQWIVSTLREAMAGKVWTLPILIVNQARYPRVPGGSLFQSLLKQKIELCRVGTGMRDLVSKIYVDRQLLEKVLVWPWSEQLPTVRCLTDSEKLRYGLSRR